MMKNQDLLGEDRVKAFIFLLFIFIHEIGKPIKCNLSILSNLVDITLTTNNITDTWGFLYNNRLYNPSSFGYLTPTVDKLYLNGEVSFRKLRRAIYKDLTQDEINNYGENMYAQLITDYCRLGVD